MLRRVDTLEKLVCIIDMAGGKVALWEWILYIEVAFELP